MDQNVESTKDFNISKDRNQSRRERDRARQNSLMAEQKDEINARRRAARQNKTLDERNSRQRDIRKNKSMEKRREDNERQHTSWQAQHNSLTDEQKEEINARRRAARQNKAFDERNAQQRASRKNLSTKERQEDNVRRHTSTQSITEEKRATLLARRRVNAT